MTKRPSTTIFTGHDSVRQAHGVIKPHIRHTGVERARHLEEGSGEVWLKLECHQITGSFKARGALYRMSDLTDKDRADGVIACSAGNHGLGVALASELYGVPATIFVPRTVDVARKRALEEYACSLHLFGEDYDQCEIQARQLAHEEGKTFISPYNDPLVIAGQGTIGIELMEQIPHMEVVLVAVGGGLHEDVAPVAVRVTLAVPDEGKAGGGPVESHHEPRRLLSVLAVPPPRADGLDLPLHLSSQGLLTPCAP